MKNPRDIIIARRALFVSTAVAALSCTPKESVDKPTSATNTSTTPTAQPEPAKPPRPWGAVMKEAPPLAIPKTAADRERQQLEALTTSMKERYGLVRAVWTATPGCDPAAKTCDDWNELQSKLEKLYRAIDNGMPGGCEGLYGTTASVVQRRQAHWQFMRARITEIEEHLAELAKGYGKAARKKWRRQLEKAKEPPPRPCLSPCAMPDVTDIVVAVPFGDNSAELDDAAKAPLNRVLSAQKRHAGKAKLVVRGHADASEKDPSGLATARAKAVRDWLVAEGISAAELSVASFGADYPVGKDRRVDFEVVQ